MCSRSAGHELLDVDASQVQVGKLFAYGGVEHNNSVHYDRKLFRF
jgi:hypothetical protein